MLELDQVSKRLGSFQLRNITIQIPTGYLCGLAGENGAGKTSLLHMLLGLYRPDSGTVRIDGKIYEENEKDESASIDKSCYTIYNGKKAVLSLRRLSGENLLFTLFRAPRRLFDSEKARE